MEPSQSSSQGFSGTINLQLTDLVQMVCLSRSDITISVKSSRGVGRIYVKQGQICHVQTDLLVGEPALFQLFQWKDGQFEMLPFQDAGISSVNKSWEYLILEAMRQRDEEAGAQASDVSAALEEGESAEVAGPDGQDASDLRQALEELLASRERVGDGAEAKSSDVTVLGGRNGAGHKETSPELDAPKEMEQNIDRAFDEIEVLSLRQPLEEGTPLEPRVAEESRVRVLVVDDSSFFARQLKKILEVDPNIEVVGTAKNGKECLEFLAMQPGVDLITLDVQMPVMKGDTTLKHIMIRYPIPVLMISTFQTESLSKIFEFLQVGAIDFISKPEVQEDITFYGERLRDVVRRTARSEVSHFRRWRKPKTVLPCSKDFDKSSKKVLVLVGAEGAYMDWFRLPLPGLCRQGLVVGLQKLSDLFVGKFCQFIEEGTSATTQPLWHSEWVGPGKFYFGNSGLKVDLKLTSEPLSMGMEVLSSDTLTWYDGVHLWLRQLAQQARERLSIYFLSGAHSLHPNFVEELLGCQTQLILSPLETVMCTDLVESVGGYSKQYPKQIAWARPEDVMEVWSKYEPDL